MNGPGLCWDGRPEMVAFFYSQKEVWYTFPNPMLRRASSILLAIPLLVPVSVLAATYAGPPAGVVPPNGNVPGLIWNFQDSADANAGQTGSQIRIGAPNVDHKIFGNLILTSGGRLGPSVNGSASTTVGNYFSSAFGPFQLNVNGGLNVEKMPGIVSALPDRDGRVQARKFCLNPVSNIPDCITAWPGSPDLSAYVAKAGDTMTGTLNVAPGAVANGIVSTGAQTGVYGTGVNYGVYGGSTVANGVGVYGYQANGMGVGGYGQDGGSFIGTNQAGVFSHATQPNSAALGTGTYAVSANGPSLFVASGASGIAGTAARFQSPYQAVVAGTSASQRGVVASGQVAGEFIGTNTGATFYLSTAPTGPSAVLARAGQAAQFDSSQTAASKYSAVMGQATIAGQFTSPSGVTGKTVELANANNAIEATGPVLFRSYNGSANLEVLSSGEVSAKGSNAGYYFFDRSDATKNRQFAWYASSDEARLYHYNPAAPAMNGTFMAIQGATGNTYNRKNIASWDVASDARLKTVEGKYARGLDEILKVQPVDFRYKDMPERNLSSAELRHGVVAQELAKSFPDAVTKGSDGYYSVNTDPVFWASVNAIKELKAENDVLKARLDAIEAKLK